MSNASAQGWLVSFAMMMSDEGMLTVTPGLGLEISCLAVALQRFLILSIP